MNSGINIDFTDISTVFAKTGQHGIKETTNKVS